MSIHYSLTLAAEAYRERLTATLSFIEAAASGRTEIDPAALQRILDGCVEYVFAAEATFNAARKCALAHSERHKQLVEMRRETARAYEDVHKLGASLNDTLQRQETQLSRLLAARDRLATLDASAAVNLSPFSTLLLQPIASSTAAIDNIDTLTGGDDAISAVRRPDTDGDAMQLIESSESATMSIEVVTTVQQQPLEGELCAIPYDSILNEECAMRNTLECACALHSVRAGPHRHSNDSSSVTSLPAHETPAPAAGVEQLPQQESSTSAVAALSRMPQEIRQKLIALLPPNWVSRGVLLLL